MSPSEAEKKSFLWLVLAYKKLYPLYKAVQAAADNHGLSNMTRLELSKVVETLVDIEEWERLQEKHGHGTLR